MRDREGKIESGWKRGPDRRRAGRREGRRRREGERRSHLSERTHEELLTFVVSIENDWVAGVGGRESRVKDALDCTSFFSLLNFDPCEYIMCTK